VLAAALLVLAMGGVFLVERADVRQRLRSDVDSRAGLLADGQQETAGATSLSDRAHEPELYLVLRPDGSIVVNQLAARALLALRGTQVGARRHVRAAGRDYLATTARAANGSLVIAGVPSAPATEEVHDLLEGMLVASVLGLLGTLALVWLAADHALRPLRAIANRARDVSPGDRRMRIGDVDAGDEIARVAEALDSMLERLEDAFDAQTRFVQDASHELRTPLTIARGHLEVLAMQDGVSEAEVRETVALAVGELERMGLLVDDLLLLARVDEGAALASRPVLVSDVVDQATSRISALGNRRLTSTLPDERLVVSGDGPALERVLLNLLANAVRHTAEGGSIAVAAGRDRARVRIDVTDDGPGIPPLALPTIFERFTRADAGRGRARGGTGLGLAICRAIVEAHGGEIAAANDPVGGGARFSLWLPAL
jgi:two-component system, OmpR family, sensor kinase